MISIVPQPANARAGHYRQGLVGADDRGSRRRGAVPAAVQAPEIAPFEPQHDIGLVECRISFFRGMRDFTNDAVKDDSPASQSRQTPKEVREMKTIDVLLQSHGLADIAVREAEPGARYERPRDRLPYWRSPFAGPYSTW
jgi:hypothetical protein